MNYRQKCKTKGKWAFIKFKGNIAIYAVCQNCGFTQQGAYEDLGNFNLVPSINKLYKYCPDCGLKMHLFNGEKVYKLDRFQWEGDK